MTAPDTTSVFAPLSTYGVATPKHLTVRRTKGNLLTDFHSFGYDGKPFFGTAFIQGNRLQFTTAMTISTLLEISKIDQAKAGSTAAEVMEKANRPKLPSHGKALRKYLLENACQGEKFILPAFAFNFGELGDDAPQAFLYIYADEATDSSNGWPALFLLPKSIMLQTTDGGHRSGEMRMIFSDTRNAFSTEQQRENLRNNACDVKIIFETNTVDSHQDFADCARAKPITGSLISTFDVRDVRNRRTVQLVRAVPFLDYYVDATASNVNLSAASIKIWSMSAMRGFTGHVQDRHPPSAGSDAEQVERALMDNMQGAEEFFGSVIKHLPQLHTLDLARLEAEARKIGTPTTPPMRTETAKTFRNKRGRDIMLRGVGISLLARAFEYAKATSMSYQEVAQRLAAVDWHLLDCEESTLPDPATIEGRQNYATAVQAHVNPIWSSMIIIGESRFKIGSSNAEVDQAWVRITAKYFDEPVAVAAE